MSTKTKPAATKTGPATNGKRWKRVERKRYRFWRFDDDATPLVGVIRAREEKNGRFGLRPIYVVDVTEPGEDRKGTFAPGDIIALNEYATLRELHEHIGREVRIAPAGYDGRIPLFDVDVAE